MGIQEPTLEEWHALHHAAVELREIEPWNYMEPYHLFGIQNPEDGDTGYCALLGAHNRTHGLCVKMGAQGLFAYGLDLASDFPLDRLARLGFVHKTLLLRLTRRRSLTCHDMKALKKLGLAFRGKDAWPQFRSITVGYFAWYLTAEEARYFTIVLEQARDLAVRFRDDPSLFEKPGISVYLTRVPAYNGDVMQWKDMWLRPPPLVLQPSFLVTIDRARLERIKGTITRREGVLELDACLINIKFGDSRFKRPYWPRMLAFVDCTNESLDDLCCSEPWSYARTFHDRFLAFIERHGYIPLEIRVSDQFAESLFEPISSALGIRLTLTGKLETLERRFPWVREARIE